MNRQNFLGHLALALTLVIVAALVGEIRHWQRREHHGVLRATINAPDAPGPVERKKEEVLVRFRPGAGLDRIKSIVLNHHDRIEDRIESVEGLDVIEDESGEPADALAADYAALPEVEYAEPNFRINLGDEPGNDMGAGSSRNALLLRRDGPNDILFDQQWSLDNVGQRGGKNGADISALRAWNKTTGSEDVVVAVIDTGVDYTHPDLIGNIWVRPAKVAKYTDEELGTIDDVHGFNAVSDNGDPMDENGHGTHCAGIIGAEGDNEEGIAGVNWHVQIMPLKFLDGNGSGTTKDAIECINYVIDRKRAGVPVRIISASWGSTQRSQALEDAIRKAGEEGILFVAASGNSRADTDKLPHYPSSYSLPNVISVAALDRHDELASFSNYGAKSVHIAAPGTEILSTWLGGTFEEHSGTSMATPEVSGVAALVLSVSPDLSVTELRERLLKSVEPLPALKGKVATGGRIDAAKAVGAD